MTLVGRSYTSYHIRKECHFPLSTFSIFILWLPLATDLLAKKEHIVLPCTVLVPKQSWCWVPNFKGCHWNTIWRITLKFLTITCSWYLLVNVRGRYLILEALLGSMWVVSVSGLWEGSSVLSYKMILNWITFVCWSPDLFSESSFKFF